MPAPRDRTHQRDVAIKNLGDRTHLTLGQVAKLCDHPQHGETVATITLQELLDVKIQQEPPRKPPVAPKTAKKTAKKTPAKKGAKKSATKKKAGRTRGRTAPRVGMP